MEDSNSLSSLANRLIGSLPIIGLVARIFSDEGGLGGDTIDFAEFRRRVGKKCSINDSRAFYEFKDRRGRVMIFIFQKFSTQHCFCETIWGILILAFLTCFDELELEILMGCALICPQFLIYVHNHCCKLAFYSFAFRL